MHPGASFKPPRLVWFDFSYSSSLFVRGIVIDHTDVEKATSVFVLKLGFKHNLILYVIGLAGSVQPRGTS